MDGGLNFCVFNFLGYYLCSYFRVIINFCVLNFWGIICIAILGLLKYIFFF